MSSLYTLAEKNMRKTWFYLAGFLGMVVFLGWFLSYYFNDQAIFWIAFIVSLVSSFASFWWSDKVVLSLSRAKPLAKPDNPELYRLVENLCITAGLPMPRLYLIDDPSPNAFATGRDPKHAVIVVTAGLLERLERVELEGVIAHEMSHIGNRDTLLATIVVVLVGLVVRVADLFFRGGFRSRDDRDSGKAGGILAIIGLVFLILAPILANLIKLAISRKREFLADADGALLTRYPEALASALEKISQSPRPVRAASNATAHLYIVNPLRGGRASNWFTKMFMTHPPIEERVKALRDLNI